MAGLQLRDVPAPARYLGLGGLIPFAVTALGPWLWPEQVLAAASIQIAYAAVILAFLGGVHWGLAMAGYGAPAGEAARQRHMAKRLAWAVTPALVGWAGALVADPTVAVTVMAGAFALLLVGDTRAAAAGLAPAWYLPLRRVLTLGVLVCLGALLAAMLVGPGAAVLRPDTGA